MSCYLGSWTVPRLSISFTSGWFFSFLLHQSIKCSCTFPQCFCKLQPSVFSRDLHRWWFPCWHHLYSWRGFSLPYKLFSGHPQGFYTTVQCFLPAFLCACSLRTAGYGEPMIHFSALLSLIFLLTFFLYIGRQLQFNTLKEHLALKYLLAN